MKKNINYFFFQNLAFKRIKTLILLEKYIENNFSTEKTQVTKIFKRLRNELLQKRKKFELTLRKVFGSEPQIRRLGKKIISTKFEIDRTTRRGCASHLKM